MQCQVIVYHSQAFYMSMTMAHVSRLKCLNVLKREGYPDRQKCLRQTYEVFQSGNKYTQSMTPIPRIFGHPNNLDNHQCFKNIQLRNNNLSNSMPVFFCFVLSLNQKCSLLVASHFKTSSAFQKGSIYNPRWIKSQEKRVMHVKPLETGKI